MEVRRNFSVYGWLAGLCSLLPIQLQSSAVYAGDQSDALNYSSLQGITVTATRTPETVLSVPKSVSIVDQKQIATEQATHLADIVENLPNIAVEGGPRPSGQNINIRGLSDQRILYLLDGARQNFNKAHNSRFMVDPELLKQVETVRGPTTLWGSGALGGVVSLTTKDAGDFLKPGENWGVKFKTGYQSVNSQWLANASTFGVAGDSLDYLLDFSYRNAGDMRQGDGNDLQNSAFETTAGLAKITWSPVLFHNFAFTTQIFDDTSGVPSNPQANTSETNPRVDRNLQQRNFIWRYTYENPEQQLIQPELTVYYNNTDLRENDTTSTRRDQTQFDTVGINLRNIMQIDLLPQLEQTLSYGIDYYHDQTQGTRDGMPRNSFPDAESDVTGLYIQDEIKLWDRLTLIPGVRWDYFANQASDPSIAAQSEDAVSFKTGLNFAVTDWLSLFASYNEAFRAPSLTELFVNGTHFTCGPGCANLFVANPNLKPEKAHNKEIGVRLQKDNLFADGNDFRFRFGYFHNEVDNFIDTVVNFVFYPVPGNPGAGGTSSNFNVNDALLTGFELEMNYDLPYGYVGASYSQTRGDNKTTNEPLSNIPADKWVLQTGIRYPLWGLSLGWRSTLVAAQNRIPAGGTATPGYDIHDLNLTWTPSIPKLSNLRMNFGINNITDRDFRKHLSVLTEPGRNFMTTVSWQF